MTSPVPFYSLLLAVFIASGVLFWIHFRRDRPRRRLWLVVILPWAVPVGGALGSLIVLWRYQPYNGTAGINFRLGTVVGALMLLTVLVMLGIELRKGARDGARAGVG